MKIIKGFLCAALAAFTVNASAEYYLVYATPTPVTCVYCNQPVRHVYHKPKPRKHTVKKVVRQRCYQPCNVCNCCSRPVKAVKHIRAYPYAVYYQPQIHDIRYNPNPDMSTADDDAYAYPDMQINY